MRRLIIGTAIIVLSPALALLPITHGSRPASAERPQSGSDLQWQLSAYRPPTNLGLSAVLGFDGSGHRIGVQIGRHNRGSPNGMTVEMTYLEPDAEHLTFYGAGDPTPLH